MHESDNHLSLHCKVEKLMTARASTSLHRPYGGWAWILLAVIVISLAEQVPDHVERASEDTKVPVCR